MPRNRPHHALRPISIVTGFLEKNSASVLYSSGATRVLCTASLMQGVPHFLEGSGKGWSTAEYDMLPASTSPRHPRERSGKLSGRTQEIQRLVGRALRGVLDLNAIPGLTLQIDCDVLQADGGTRTASVNGAYIAAAIAVSGALASGRMARSPLLQAIGAVSVGVVDGQVCLDLDYTEDSGADVDLNVVLAESGMILEIQGTSESSAGAFGRARLNEMLDVATAGIQEIFSAQRRALSDTTH